MPFPEIEDVILVICGFLAPRDVAQLGAACRLLHESCRLDRTWLRFFAREFRAQPRRSAADYRLSVFQLFARKQQRRLLQMLQQRLQQHKHLHKQQQQ